MLKYQHTILKNWLLQSSEKIAAKGEKISLPGFCTDRWYPVTVPGTVVGGLVENKVYGDPCFGLNMQSIPGYKHGKTTHFSFHPMPDDSPFCKPWWFRNEFTLDSSFAGRRTWLKVDGVNFSANVWLNGRLVADAGALAGSYRRHDLDVTSAVLPLAKNVLALEIIPPKPDDLCVTFIDWNPVPPDDSMGLWQPVSIRSTGPVAIQHPFVRSELDTPSLRSAGLFISAELVNSSDTAVTGRLEGTIEQTGFSKEVSLAPFERKEVVVSPGEFLQLTIRNPRVWWPYQFGSAELYTLRLDFAIDTHVSDSTAVTFGIRDIRSCINQHGARQFAINGQDLLIRGSAWSPDLMLRQSTQRDDIDIAYLKNMHLNAFRLEGMLASDYFWDRCDQKGILVLAGWPCCTHWEKWDAWKPEDMIIARESLRSQIQRLRNHPSFIAWLYGSDYPPPEPVERMYLQTLEQTHKTLPALSNASARPSALAGATGVKMSGPYSYVPPSYWYTATMPGVADSFNTETGPDVCIPVFESLKKMLPGDQLFVGSNAWNHHAGLASFINTDVVNDAVIQRYGKPKDLQDFAQAAQILGYECWRAMFEAYGRNFPKGTGVIAWMHNSAWPSMIWQLYDYYLHQTGAFYGAKKACEPLHLQYSYDDASVWIVNGTPVSCDSLVAHARVYTLDAKRVFEHSQQVAVKKHAQVRAFSIPEMNGLSPVYFVFLELRDTSRLVCTNCYWISTTKDVFAEKSDRWFSWPLTQHADMSALRLMPKAAITATCTINTKKGEYSVTVTIQNISGAIAFFLWAKVINKSSKESISPVFWSDNCLTLLPGQETTLCGTFHEKISVKNIDVIVEGWNLTVNSIAETIAGVRQ